jgi:hypothetical protein
MKTGSAVEERFLSAPADGFAKANAKEKIGLLGSEWRQTKARKKQNRTA